MIGLLVRLLVICSHLIFFQVAIFLGFIFFLEQVNFSSQALGNTASTAGISYKMQKQSVNEVDSLALVAFYESTNGADWHNSANWLTGRVGSWYGVTVSNGRVTALNLSANDVGGLIPPKIGLLDALEKLNLSLNHLSGELPEELGNLTQLRVFDLQQNRWLSGAIPDGITNMTLLEELMLNNYRFQDLPDLSALAGVLSTVAIENNQFSFEDIEPNVGLSFTFTYENQNVPYSSTILRDDEGNFISVKNNAFVYKGNKLAFHYDVGGEHNVYQMTKDQWVMSARDSLYQTFYRAGDLYASSSGMAVYPITEPPRAPVRFSVWGRPNQIDLEWTPANEGPDVVRWELFRTTHWEDNQYVNGCQEDPTIKCGYELIATLPPESTSYADLSVLPGIEYFYYIQAIGEVQPDDPEAIAGTPKGAPLRSSRYLTQTYTPVSLHTAPPPTFIDFRLEDNYPNPFSSQTRIRYSLPEASDVELVIYDMLGRNVEVLVNAYQSAGNHERFFDATGFASGLYFYMLRAG